MSKNRASTLQEKFGFGDEDLRKPAHDKIMIWLDGEVERIAAAFLADKITPGAEAIEQMRVEARKHYEKESRTYDGKPPPVWPGLGDPPPGRFVGVINRTWEYPICSDRKFVVGFADMRVIVEYVATEWNIEGSRYTPSSLVLAWCERRNRQILVFEVKSSIPSVGEVIRQIRLYQQFLEGDYLVVSPDARFASVLADQGIGFVQVPRDVA